MLIRKSPTLPTAEMGFQTSSPVVVDTTSYSQIYLVTINRPSKRNAVDLETATLLQEAFTTFAEHSWYKVAILQGSSGNFCAGADLNNIIPSRYLGTTGYQEVDKSKCSNLLSSNMDDMGPMGPTRMVLPKPVIASIEGYAVAGGLELAAWCDLRVASCDAKLGVLCRSKGVPLIDGGTVRLPRLIGLSRAMDLVLTGRLVGAEEAERMGLVNQVVQNRENSAVPTTSSGACISFTLAAAISIAKEIISHPEPCMLNDRASMIYAEYGTNINAQEGTTGSGKGKWNAKGALRKALEAEFQYGLKSLEHLGESGAVQRFLERGKMDGGAKL